QWNKSSQPGFSFIGGYLMFAAIDKDPQALADFVELARRLVAALAPAYGEIRSMAVKGWDAPMNLQLRLPDVPPISIYGREYIELFGRDAIEAAPFQSVERVGEAYWLVASESLREGVGDEARARIRAHFGEDAFMANGKWKYQDGRAPRFDLSWSVA
ncbi:MAG TPA: hypothetical protein VFM34_05490, partial [Moraxellaceae bacterium]|nr:hypothetical protein [Moraxellaceae bacterium]